MRRPEFVRVYFEEVEIACALNITIPTRIVFFTIVQNSENIRGRNSGLGGMNENQAENGRFSNACRLRAGE